MKEEFVSCQLYEDNCCYDIEEAIDLTNAIDNVLKPREKYILGLRMYGYTYKEIAEKIDRSRERVRQIIGRAYRRLISRRCLRSYPAPVFSIPRELRKLIDDACDKESEIKCKYCSTLYKCIYRISFKGQNFGRHDIIVPPDILESCDYIRDMLQTAVWPVEDFFFSMKYKR